MNSRRPILALAFLVLSFLPAVTQAVPAAGFAGQVVVAEKYTAPVGTWFRWADGRSFRINHAVEWTDGNSAAGVLQMLARYRGGEPLPEFNNHSLGGLNTEAEANWHAAFRERFGRWGSRQEVWDFSAAIGHRLPPPVQETAPSPQVCPEPPPCPPPVCEVCPVCPECPVCPPAPVLSEDARWTLEWLQTANILTGPGRRARVARLLRELESLGLLP